MTTKIRLVCATCNSVGTITLDKEYARVDIGGSIDVDLPCPGCGERVSAPGGRYERDDGGYLVRTGDVPADA